MQEKIYITAGGRQCEYKAGTTFKEIAEDFQKEYKDETLLFEEERELTVMLLIDVSSSKNFEQRDRKSVV